MSSDASVDPDDEDLEFERQVEARRRMSGERDWTKPFENGIAESTLVEQAAASSPKPNWLEDLIWLKAPEDLIDGVPAFLFDKIERPAANLPLGEGLKRFRGRK